MIFHQNIWGALRDRADNGVFDTVGTGAPVNGVTGLGTTGPGSTYTNLTTGIRYTNFGTLASPVWAVASAASITEAMLAALGTAGLGAVRLAMATFDYSTDGGTVGTITPLLNATIPNKAIILGGIIDVVTTITSGGSATVAIGTSAGSSGSSIKAATAIASITGLTAVVPVFTSATMFKMTAAGVITCTVATAALTAGKFNVILVYVVGN